MAVLLFDNLSEDREQEYLSDGFTENMISTLTQSPELFVIDRISVSTYKKRPIKVKQVDQELGIQYSAPMECSTLRWSRSDHCPAHRRS